MKRWGIKRIVAMMLAAVMLITMMPMSAEAKHYATRGSWQFLVPADNWSGEIHDAYDNREDANECVRTLYVSEDKLPVQVVINGKDPDNMETFILDEYKTYYLKMDDSDFARLATDMVLFFSIVGIPALFRDKPYCFVTVTIAPPEQKPENQIESQIIEKKPSAEELLDQRWKDLLDEIDFPFWYTEYSAYAKEVKAYLAGEWDGSKRTGGVDTDSVYLNAMREVMGRNYYWIATNYITGEAYMLSANVDYIGYKEVIPGTTKAQKYSLAVSRLDGEIEMWSLLEQKDAWTIDEVAKGLENFENILPLSTGDSAEDDTVVFVFTLDADGNQHMYSLLPGGKVKKTL